jgi:hypothetical protein
MRDLRLPPRSRRELLFWYITQRVVVIPYGSFGTAYRSHLQGTFEDGSDSLSRKVGKNYHYRLRNIPEERQFSLLSALSTRSIKTITVSDFF